MRRRTPGVSPVLGSVPKQIELAERRDPEEVIRLLEPLVLPRRAERLKHVISQRISSVTLCFDHPYDPHNGAALLRSAEAFGVQFIHVIEREDQFVSVKSVSRGSERWLDVRSFPETRPCVQALKDQGYTLVSACAEGELLPQDLRDIPRLALALGNEHDGIAQDLMAASDARVRVPMRGFVESLNVSVTCAILLAHATEGRSGDLNESEQRRLYARGLYLSVDRPERVLEHLT
jgi:tRNA (guanosine-2'-O-)-methyltransferase